MERKFKSRMIKTGRRKGTTKKQLQPPMRDRDGKPIMLGEDYVNVVTQDEARAIAYSGSTVMARDLDSGRGGRSQIMYEWDPADMILLSCDGEDDEDEGDPDDSDEDEGESCIEYGTYDNSEMLIEAVGSKISISMYAGKSEIVVKMSAENYARLLTGVRVDFLRIEVKEDEEFF